MTTGVVVGRFLPPHRGHKHLIDRALSQVDHLDVLVCERPDQPLDGATRAAWLREIHPEAHVVVVTDDIPDDLGDETSLAWAQRTVAVLGRAPDLVFTSEDYGVRYAGFLGARHVAVDPGRRAFPVSGTAVRADPSRHWRYLEPCVRAHYVRRVSVVGAESTGTTTLALALADRYGTECVPEYGRRYWEERVATGVPLVWATDDFDDIARRQLADEDAAARRSPPILICDTDALATSIWHERYLGDPSPAVEQMAAARHYALSILTANDIAFVQDGTRDGEHIRAWMTCRFRVALAGRSDPWIEVRGTKGERLATATAAIDALLNPGRRSPPARGRTVGPPPSVVREPT